MSHPEEWQREEFIVAQRQQAVESLRRHYVAAGQHVDAQRLVELMYVQERARHASYAMTTEDLAWLLALLREPLDQLVLARAIATLLMVTRTSHLSPAEHQQVRQVATELLASVEPLIRQYASALRGAVGDV
jgi:hypothetical protein